MNKQIIIGVLAVILIGGGAYYFTSSKSNVASDGHTDHTHEQEDMAGMEGMDHSNMNMGGGMMDMTMSDMVKMMDGKTGRALEKEFISGMIPHHQGAVDMSKRLLQDTTISAEMRKFGEDIIKAQEGEIKMMNEWLKKY